MYHYTRIPRIVFIVAIITYSHIGFSDEHVWETLKMGGHIVLMRHAAAEKVGDPLAFKPNDCSVQRNLSRKGRQQAESIGRAFRARSIPVGEVLSSRYCRTQETARLAFGQVTAWQPLDLLNALPDKDRDARTDVVAKRIGVSADTDNLVMITHKPNIYSLTSEIVDPGGFLLLKPDHKGRYDIVGHFKPDDLRIK